jgi:hypothetical protein
MASDDDSDSGNLAQATHDLGTLPRGMFDDEEEATAQCQAFAEQHGSTLSIINSSKDKKT